MLNVNNNIKVETDEQNEIWKDGFTFGKECGAEQMIEYLQAKINNNGGMQDLEEIKMFIYSTWKNVTLDKNTDFNIDRSEK